MSRSNETRRLDTVNAVSKQVGRLLRVSGLGPGMAKLGGGVDRSVHPLATSFHQRQRMAAHLKLTLGRAVPLGMCHVAQIRVLTHCGAFHVGIAAHRGCGAGSGPPLRRSTPQVIDATSAWKFMNVAHIAGRRGRVRCGLAPLLVAAAMFMPLALPSTLDHRVGVVVEGVGAGRPPSVGAVLTWAGPRCDSLYWSNEHHLHEWTWEIKKGDLLVALVPLRVLQCATAGANVRGGVVVTPTWTRATSYGPGWLREPRG